MMTEEKFSKEREQVLRAARQGISSNIPLAGVQKKYLKNLLLFALMNASGNETVTNRNFIKLVNKLFKKFLIQIIKKAEDDDDDETFEEALDVELNRIVANKEMLDLQTLQSILTPSNIIANIKMNIDGLSQRQVLNKLLSPRDAFVNHRETPEEAREREQRQKEYELQKNANGFWKNMPGSAVWNVKMRLDEAALRGYFQLI
ncbi:MAG: hypothetical protein ACLU99_00660 [Alphaproteobacteria bacterium]